MSGRAMAWFGAALTGVLLTVVVGCAGPAASDPVGVETAPVTPAAPSTTTTTPTPSPSITGPRPLPEREEVNVVGLDIPSIGVQATKLEHLALMADRRLAAPQDPDLAGWFADGPVPGDTGPAVIAGHVDSDSGPAVFWKLSQLRPGDEVQVRLSDGSTVVFRVDRSIQVPKNDFPTTEVYGPVPDAQLRLITCDGDWIRDAGGYQDNTVVFATMVEHHEAGA